tara:strand:+ start:774 stop:1904 length:1131 start_codon:yes stop_codon:yes gene_type:complete
MKIGLITRSDLDDKLYWSGTVNSVYENLKKNKKIKVIKIDKLNNTLRKITALKREYFNFFNKEKFDESYTEIVSKNFGQQIERKIKYKDIDILLAFDSSLIAYIKTKIPIFLWTDLLYSDYYDHYYKNEKISKVSKASINKIEKKAIKRCQRIFLSSNWAIKKANKKYRNFSKKFKLLEFGPSLKSEISKKYVLQKIKTRPKKILNLITLSVNWKRKGISKILKINKIINSKGVKSKLTIIGLKKKVDDKNINFVDFINKNTKKGYAKISKFLLENHFHLLLSNAEAYGIALVEANSRGLPNIAYNVGGIRQIVTGNVNGKLFDEKIDLEEISNYIIKLFLNKKKYEKLCISSYKEYNRKFSYKKIISKFCILIKN